MILFDLVKREEHPAYQELEISNGNRQYSFLNSIVSGALAVGRPFLSQQIIKALNFHAICCLHTHAGEYRPCSVYVGDYTPPEHYQVAALMDDFVNLVNWYWEKEDAIVLASFVLWRLNFIHPFINGNGRTARATAYFVLCVKSGGNLPGDKILPELLRDHRKDYIACLKIADRAFERTGEPDLEALHRLLLRLIERQIG